MRPRSVRFNNLTLPILYRTPSLFFFFFFFTMVDLTLNDIFLQQHQFQKETLFGSIFRVIFAFNDIHRFVIFVNFLLQYLYTYQNIS